MDNENNAQTQEIDNNSKTATPAERLNELKALQKEGVLSTKQSLEMRKLNKVSSSAKKQQKSFQKMVKSWQENQSKQNRRLMQSVKEVFDIIGKKNFKMLKDLYTVNVEEKKDDQGNVTQKASSYVNYVGLLQEAKHVIIVEREARIKAGKRKRTTGKSSKRSAHQLALRFLENRNIEAKKEN